MPDISELTPKQQTSEAIRQAESILVTTGQHPSVDQVTAVLGLTMILRKFGKQATAQISEGLPQSVQTLDTSVLKSAGGSRDFVLKLDVSKAEVDKLRYEVQDGKLNIIITPFKGGFAPSDVTFGYGSAKYDLVIVLGVPTRARLDKVYEQNPTLFENTPVVNIDFHRSNENYGAVNLIDPTASSLCEMLVALSESLQGGIIDEPIATTLLMGIIAATDRFTAAHTTSKSLTVAAQMMAAGAKQQSVVRALYKGGSDQPRGDRGGDRGERKQQTREQRPSEQRQNEPRPERRPEQERREPAPERKSEEEPIIDPAHIELSEEPKAEAPAAEDGPREVPPMADFAAAAEILAKHQRSLTEDDEQDDYEA
jgi:DHH family